MKDKLKLIDDLLQEAATKRCEEWVSYMTAAQRRVPPSQKAIPRHPSLIYRLSGDWVSWSHFLSTAPSPENRLDDLIDEIAWGLFCNKNRSGLPN